MLRTISILLLSCMLVGELKISIDFLVEKPILGNLIGAILLIFFTFVPYLYIILN